VHASGVVTPAEGGEFLATAPEPARIAEITKAEGDPVTSGELLVRFDLPSATQDVARLAADLAGAQAQFENARINQTRVRDFVERGLVPRRDLDAADRDAADAQAVLDRVRAQQASAIANAGRAIVRAPFTGIVVRSTMDPVVRVVDPRRLDIIVAVAEKDGARVVPGAPARIAAATGAPPVLLTVASRVGDRASTDGTLSFRVLFKEPTDLPVDTRVEIDIDAEERTDVVVVPAEALVREDGGMAVMVVSGARAERRAVTTGLQDAQSIEIMSGVRAGEMVITRGHLGLADGAAISVAAEP
jgi:RND family efflux transporter MFP subunit